MLEELKESEEKGRDTITNTIIGDKKKRKKCL